MGVPSFYRWLVNKYPDVRVPAREAKAVNTNEPNPNGMEFDNLYLDMNGIIHPCFHPEDELFQPTTFDQVFDRIFVYIDRLFQIVRPRKLLYLAIDGVAPRAKMNQQRSRRFRAAKDAEISDAEEEKLRKQFKIEGKNVLPKLVSQVSDSNIITPGTEFMDKLSKALQIYVRSRLNSDPGWENIKVILSDVNVPGEGEHKIINFIRLQRNMDGYDPNTQHCLYGLDADLIMLALATHEVHFSILREDVLGEKQRPSCKGSLDLSRKPYEFLNIWTMREYLELDLAILNPPFQIDIERVIDDFIFICFFSGNDFLPHMPSLVINEGAIDLLIHVYKTEFTSRGGYLVDMEKVDSKKTAYVELKRVEKFILSVGTYEDKIFKKRMDIRQATIQSLLRKMTIDVEDQQEDSVVLVPIQNLELNSRNGYGEQPCPHGMTSGSCPELANKKEDTVLENTEELKGKLKDVLREKASLLKPSGLNRDKIRLGIHGWKDRYYKEKFGAESRKEMETIRKEIVEKYTEGLCWVLQYYFFGVRSWTWYYPFHYGPFASDLKCLASVSVKFNMGTPFKPFDQLMGVLPPRSVDALPKAYGHLMTSEDSPLKEFYPVDFEIDVDGKLQMWQGTIKLPFLNEERLLSETKKIENELKIDEMKRNSVSVDKMYVLKSNGLAGQIESLLQTQKRQSIDASTSSGINGFLLMCNESSGEEDMADNNVICAHYEYPAKHPHIPRLLENVTIPERTIAESYVEKRSLWHEYEGHNPPNRWQMQSRNIKTITGGRKVSSSGSSSEKEIYKGVGSGWSTSRGKVNAVTSNLVQNPETYRGTKSTCSVNMVSSDLHPGSGTWSLGRGRGFVESSWKRSSNASTPIQAAHACKVSAKNPETYRGMQTTYIVKTASSSIHSGSGRWHSESGSGYMESSYKGNSESARQVQVVNSCKVTSPGPPTGQGRAWSNPTNRRENISYTTLRSECGSGTSRGSWVEKKGSWTSGNVPPHDRTNVWRRQDSSSAGRVL